MIVIKTKFPQKRQSQRWVSIEYGLVSKRYKLNKPSPLPVSIKIFDVIRHHKNLFRELPKKGCSLHYKMPWNPFQHNMISPWHGNFFCIIGHLWRPVKSTGQWWIPFIKGQQYRTLIFLCYYPVEWQSSCQWFETPWCSYDITVMTTSEIYTTACINPLALERCKKIHSCIFQTLLQTDG